MIKRQCADVLTRMMPPAVMRKAAALLKAVRGWQSGERNECPGQISRWNANCSNRLRHCVARPVILLGEHRFDYLRPFVLPWRDGVGIDRISLTFPDNVEGTS